jgi:hypothetical protein
LLAAMVEHQGASLAELSRLAGIGEARTSTRLTKLAERGLAESPQCCPGRSWALTDQGRAVALSERPLIDDLDKQILRVVAQSPGGALRLLALARRVQVCPMTACRRVADATPAKPSGPLNLSWIDTSTDVLALNARINFFTNYYSISPGMFSFTPGKGANYLIALTDSEGMPLSGGDSYGLKLPPNIPAANFWSVTLYDAANSSGLANGQPFPSLGSRDKPAQNADGSTDLYFGPDAPDGKAGNWRATVRGEGYFAILRLYGPTKAAMDKSWKPGDFVKTH